MQVGSGSKRYFVPSNKARRPDCLPLIITIKPFFLDIFSISVTLSLDLCKRVRLNVEWGVKIYIYLTQESRGYL